VSKKIRKELESKFESTNSTILEKIFHAVFDGNDLVQAISNDEQFRNMLRNMGEGFQRLDNGLSGTASQDNANARTEWSPQSQQTANTSDISEEFDLPPAYSISSSLSTPPVNSTLLPILPPTAVEPASSFQQVSPSSLSSQPSSSLEGTSTPALNPEPYRLVRAKFTVPTQSPDELGLHTNDIVHVVDDGLSDDGWLKARWLHDEGKSGYVPKSFVEDF